MKVQGKYRGKGEVCRSIALFAAIVITLTASAADCNLVWNDGVGTSVANAAEWFDASNWQGGNIAQSAADWAFLTNKSGRLFVHADRALTLGKLNAYRGGLTNNGMTTNDAYQVYFISDHGVSIPYVPSDGKSMISQVRLYADLTLSSGEGAYCDSILLCGDMDNAVPAAFNTALTHHLDLYANAAGEERVNPGTTNSFRQSWGSPTWYAPQGASADVVGQWSQTAGSRYLIRTGAAHVLCAGTLVHGDGIPSGAFLKRIFDGGTIEISQPATQTIAGNSITFDAFSPKVSQFIATYNADAGGSSGETSYACKHRAEDEFTMEIGRITLTAAKNRRFATKAGCHPARWLLHDASAVHGKIYLADCHLEFAARMNGDVSAVGIPNADVIQENAAHKSRLTIGSGLSGSIQCISNLVGTVVKDGGGALRASLARNAALNTGTLVVENGVFELAGAAEHYVKTLAISNGAAIRISDGGSLRVDVLNVAPGARVEGGAIQVSSLSDCTAARAAGLVCADGGCLSCPGTSDAVLWEPAATNVPGNPALWFDLSSEATFTTATAAYDGKERITRLNDVRGAGYMFATNTTSVQGPRIVRDTGGNPRYYFAEHISGAENDKVDKQHVLVWNARLANIRSVFKVLSQPVNVRGAQFLGCTWDNNSGWLRPGGVAWNLRLFHYDTVAVYPAVSNGEFRVNGFLRNWQDGLAYPGGKTDTARAECDYVPQVVELHLADGASPAADNCGDFTRGSGNAATPRAGGTMLYEMLVYTNDLTAAEKLQIRGYLMKKWLDAEAEYAMDASHPANGGAVDVGTAGWNFGVSSGNVRLASVTGAGPVEKHGAGTLYVEDHARPTATLKVSEGRMVLRSGSPAADDLPKGAYLHVDASDGTTYDLDGSGNVVTWRDRRGAGHPTMTKIGSGASKPKADMLNGLTMIDIPVSENASDATSAGFAFTACNDARSVFSVLISQTNATKTIRYNGSLLLGTHEQASPVTGGMHYGIWRYGGGCHQGTIIDNSSTIYTGIDSLLCYYGIGASRGRLDGVERNFTNTYYKCDGTGDMASFVTYERIRTDALAQGWNNGASKAYWGSQILGETIVYQTALSPSSVDKVEAYLNKKWFARETAGYRPASAASLEVSDGAELELVGNAPIIVTALSGSGTIRGDVLLSNGAELAVEIVGGEISPITLTGTLEGAATVRVSGNPRTLPVGQHVLLTAASVPDADWDVVFDTPDDRRPYQLRRTATSILLEVQPRGMMMILR